VPPVNDFTAADARRAMVQLSSPPPLRVAVATRVAGDVEAGVAAEDTTATLLTASPLTPSTNLSSPPSSPPPPSPPPSPPPPSPPPSPPSLGVALLDDLKLRARSAVRAASAAAARAGLAGHGGGGGLGSVRWEVCPSLDGAGWEAAAASSLLQNGFVVLRGGGQRLHAASSGQAGAQIAACTLVPRDTCEACAAAAEARLACLLARARGKGKVRTALPLRPLASPLPPLPARPTASSGHPRHTYTTRARQFHDTSTTRDRTTSTTRPRHVHNTSTTRPRHATAPRPRHVRDTSTTRPLGPVARADALGRPVVPERLAAPL